MYALCFATELSIIVNPSTSGGYLADPTTSSASSSIFQIFLPSRVQYQHIQYLHQVLVFLNVGLGRVAPRLFPDDSQTQEAAAITQLNALVSMADREGEILPSFVMIKLTRPISLRSSA